MKKEHCASDARVTYAALTETGIEKFEQARATHLADVEALFGSRFSDDEHDQLAELLSRLPLADAGACNSE